jgi:serine protease Do
MVRTRRDHVTRSVALASFAVVALGATASAQSLKPERAAPAPGTPTDAAVAQLQSMSDAFATIAARVRPSVVYITAKQAPRLAEKRGRVAPQLQGLPPEMQRFFQMPGMPGDGEDGPRGGGTASGSGFVVSQDGYVLTNNHVVDGASKVTVRLLARREFQARVVGTDPATDVAVLKIDATGLTPAPFGNSDAARVGEWVLAVGNPLGENLTFTVTQGIISAKGRALNLPGRTQTSIQDFIQTDAAINPGNSGGPLINVRGEVIGINSAIASPTGTSVGYGFAVPINLARSVMDQIRTSGHVERVGLGILVRDATTEDAAYVGLKENRGILVQDFPSASSPAKKAGLQAGDVIISVGGHNVDYVAQLQEAIAFKKPGEMVDVEVARKGGARALLHIPLQRVPEYQTADRESRAPARRDERPAPATLPSLGITVAPTDAEAVRELKLPADVRGAIVTDIDDASPLAGRLATPQLGGPDVILSVEDTPVTSPESLRAAIRTLKPGEIVSLRVYNVPAKSRRIERVRLATSQ